MAAAPTKSARYGSNLWSSHASNPNSVFNTLDGAMAHPACKTAVQSHNSFVMPSQDVTVTGSQKTFTPFTLAYEKIKCVNILKNVYYYFPAGHKGVVYLLHGSGGSAQNIATDFEWSQMINDLVSANYAIIVTESEEVSLNTDFNGDGKLNWDAIAA